MKKFLFLLIFSISIGFTSCKCSNDSPVETDIKSESIEAAHETQLPNLNNINKSNAENADSKNDAPRRAIITAPKPNLEKQPEAVETPADFNILTVAGDMDARIKWAVALKAANVVSLPFSHTVVAVGERIAGTNTFKFHEMVNGVADPNKPWKGAGAYYLALSITEENDGNQWIAAGGAGVLRAPTKHSFKGESFTVNWGRFMKNPF